MIIMGGKHKKYDLSIEKNLLDGFMLGSDLYNVVLKEKNAKTGEEFNKAFNYALNKLLEEEKIQIIGYRKRDRKPEQSFKFNPFFFELVGKDEGEILILLNQLIGNNIKDMNLIVLESIDNENDRQLLLKKLIDYDVKNNIKARNQLLNCFNHKIKQLEEIDLNIFNEFKEKVDLITLKDWTAEIKEKGEDYGNTPQTDKIRSIIRWYERNLDNIHNSSKKNGDKKFWRLRINDLTKEEMNKINLLPPALAKNEYPTIESFLEAKGIYKPERDYKEIKRQFREILFFILISENNKLKNYFALALSNDEESLDWFKLFIQHKYTHYSKNELSDLLDKTEFIDPEKEKRNKMKEQLAKMGEN